MGKHIILIGMRGVGKSYLGKKIAEYFGMLFIDIDTLIEQNEHISIRAMVEKHGWEYFRDKEHEALLSIAAFAPSVIALGAGAPIFERNKPLIKSLGFRVWVQEKEDVIIERLTVPTAHRPALSVLSTEDEVKQLIQDRTPHYKALSEFVFSSSGDFEEQCAKLKDTYSSSL